MHPALLLGVDPGTDSGWALFGTDGLLLDCGLGWDSARACVPLALVGRAVIEHPFVYPRGGTRDPNAVVKLAINAGEWKQRMTALGARVEMPLPVQWKGGMPKATHHRLIKRTLGLVEVLRFDERAADLPASKVHNVLDAIGLGLFGAGRLRP